MSLLKHDIGECIVHVLLPFRIRESPVMMMLHVPHLGSLHFVTSLLIALFENSAFVKICFKFFGCLLLTMRSVFFSVDSIFFECRKKFMLCLTIFTICGLLGLWVMTNARVLLLLSDFFFGLRSSSIVSFFAFSIPLLISFFG